jgi:hypothetical protein
VEALQVSIEWCASSFQNIVPEIAASVLVYFSLGMLGWTVAMPFDVPKTNVQSRYDTKVFGSFVPEVRRIFRDRGVRGLYMGLGPTVIRAFPANAALFLGVELSKKFFDDFVWAPP